jgi:hypothetical protein
VTALPRFAPSSWNCTLATPMLLDALAVTTTVADTVAPFAGEVIETVGGGVVWLFTVTVIPALVVLLPAVSLAIAVRAWAPLLVFVVSHENV